MALLIMEKNADLWYIRIMKRTFFFSNFFSRCFLAIILCIFSVLPLIAGDFSDNFSWFFSGSVLFFPEDNGVNSDPGPILPSFGLGADLPIYGPLRAEITLDVYFTHYRYDFGLDRAVPVSVENRSARVIGPVLGIPLSAWFTLTPHSHLRIYGGPAADLRIVFLAANLNEDLDPMDEIRKEVSAVKDYFWSGGRWFLPVFGAGMDFDFSPKIKLGFDTRVWFPVYKLWTNEDLPAIEGWRFGLGARISFL